MQPGRSAPAPVRDRIRAEDCNERGLALLQEGRLAPAAEQFEQALAADPYYGAAHSNLGVALFKQGRYYEAGWQLDAARKLLPKSSAPRCNLALLYEAVGRYGEAEDELRAALQLAPDDIEIIGQLARVHVRQHKCTPETLAWLQTIATQDDDATWRGWARQQLLHDRALDDVDRPHSEEPP